MAIEKVVNNGFGAYKSTEAAAKPSWGVERISFNGLASTSTPGTSMLPNRDPRFRFVDGNTAWFAGVDSPFSGNGNVNGSIDNFSVRIPVSRDSTDDYTGELFIDFYGNDINLLIGDNIVFAGDNWRVECFVDGETTARSTLEEVQNSKSGVISENRTYKSNQVLPLNLSRDGNTLAVGSHTVRLAITSVNPSSSDPTAVTLPLFGCEIVNDKVSLTSTIDVTGGDLFSDGYRYRFDSSENLLPIIPSSYTYSDSGTGTAKGARVVSYINPLTQIQEQVINTVDATQLNLTAAVHTNEEIIRRVNIGEFGANDDFATATAANSTASTLNDGLTNLRGTSAGGNLGIGTADNGRFISFNRTGASDGIKRVILTFIGSGLDVNWRTTGADDGVTTVYIDGTSIGTLPALNDSTTVVERIRPIVSGLPYGTHTCVIESPANSSGYGNAFGIVDYLIYGPAKPAIPAAISGAAVELTDYNIVADYRPTTLTGTDNVFGAGGTTSIGLGIIRQQSERGFRYQGAWIRGTGTVNSLNGVDIFSNNSNNNLYFSFYGTGFDFRYNAEATGSKNKNLRIFIDQDFTDLTGTITPLDLSSNFTTYGNGSATVAVGNAASRAANTKTTGDNPAFAAQTNGQLNITAASTENNAGLVVTGLTLGWHTVKIFQGGTGSTQFIARSCDAICPIHAPAEYSDAIGTVRNAAGLVGAADLYVGNLSINDTREDYPNIGSSSALGANLGEAKAWIKYNRATNTINGSYNISAVAESGSGSFRNYDIFFDKPFKDNDYVWIGQKGGAGSTSNNVTGQTQTANAFRFELTNIGTFGANWFAAFYGELIDE